MTNDYFPPLDVVAWHQIRASQLAETAIREMSGKVLETDEAGIYDDRDRPELAAELILIAEKLALERDSWTT